MMITKNPAHNFSYAATAFRGGALIAWTLYKRRTPFL
jgi:hypothetical protein